MGIHIIYSWVWIFIHLSFTIEAKDLKADAWRASSLDLMEMSEEVEPRFSPSVVQLTLCQNTQQSRLAWVHITQYSYSQVQELQAKHKGKKFKMSKSTRIELQTTIVLPS